MGGTTTEKKDKMVQPIWLDLTFKLTLMAIERKLALAKMKYHGLMVSKRLGAKCKNFSVQLQCDFFARIRAGQNKEKHTLHPFLCLIKNAL